MLTNKFLNLAEKLNNHNYFTAIKNTALILIPLTVAITFLTFLISITYIFKLNIEYQDLLKLLESIRHALIAIYPYVASILISITLNKLRKKVGNNLVTAFPCMSLVLFNIIVDNKLTFGSDLKLLRAIIITFIIYELSNYIEKTFHEKFLHKEVNSFKNTIFIIIQSAIIITSVTFMGVFYKNHLNNLPLDPSTFINLGNSLWGLIVYVIVLLFPWLFGLNGSQLVAQSYETLYQNHITNVNLINGGLNPSTIVDQTFIDNYIHIGGSGATICLLLALFISKNKQLKDFGKLATIPSLFNINEIIIYGLPIVANIYMIIPFLFVPIIFAALSYFAILFNIIPVATVSPSWMTPPIINTFISTNGSMAAVIYQIFLIIIGTYIYHYFLNKYNKVTLINLSDKFDFFRLSHSGKRLAEVQLKVLKDINIAKAEVGKIMNRGEFILYYQPIYDLIDKKIIKFETLIRIKHETKGIIPPYFLTWFNTLNLMEDTDVWILEHALKEQKKLKDAGHDYMFSINISSAFFTSDDFIKKVTHILNVTGADTNKIEFELVEESFHEDLPSAIKKINSIRSLGIKISIDDFGTGYSSLSHLLDFDIDTIKIDRKFILGIEHQKGQRIINNIIKLSKSLNCECVTEGIEKKSEIEFILSAGGRYIQGYYIAKPAPLDEVIKKLNDDRNKKL